MKELFNTTLEIFKSTGLDKWIVFSLFIAIATNVGRSLFGLEKVQKPKAEDYQPQPYTPHYPRYHARTPRKVKRARWKNN
jgi:hypothetical protein